MACVVICGFDTFSEILPIDMIDTRMKEKTLNSQMVSKLTESCYWFQSRLSFDWVKFKTSEILFSQKKTRRVKFTRRATRTRTMSDLITVSFDGSSTKVGGIC